jgi:hypothetical protein
MKNIEAPMPTCKSVRRGKPFSCVDHIRKVADLELEPATSPVRLKLRPKQRRLPRRDPFPKLREAEGIAQLKLTQRSDGKSTSLGLHPSYRPGRVRIVPIESK